MHEEIGEDHWQGFWVMIKDDAGSHHVRDDKYAEGDREDIHCWQLRTVIHNQLRRIQ